MLTVPLPMCRLREALNLGACQRSKVKRIRDLQGIPGSTWFTSQYPRVPWPYQRPGICMHTSLGLASPSVHQLKQLQTVLSSTVGLGCSSLQAQLYNSEMAVTPTNQTHPQISADWDGMGIHLVLAGHIHFVAEELGEVHDGHGCWAPQESHSCLWGRGPSEKVYLWCSRPTAHSSTGAKTHLLLVPIPILHEALLLLSVPRREREKLRTVELLDQMHV